MSEPRLTGVGGLTGWSLVAMGVVCWSEEKRIEESFIIGLIIIDQAKGKGKINLIQK